MSRCIYIFGDAAVISHSQDYNAVARLDICVWHVYVIDTYSSGHRDYSHDDWSLALYALGKK